MLTPEQRAEQNRQNAQKSTGPKSDAGKLRSAKNAIKHGERAQLLKNFVPPHAAVLCNQDRQRYFRLHEQLIEKYKPRDPTEALVVSKIAAAEWRALTFSELFTAYWNKELMEKFDGRQHPIPEIADILGQVRVYESQADHPAVEKMHQRLQWSLERSIANHEKRLVLLRKQFPSASTVIERRDFDRERRDFYRAYPNLLTPDQENDQPAGSASADANPASDSPVNSAHPVTPDENRPAHQPEETNPQPVAAPANPIGNVLPPWPQPANEADFCDAPRDDEFFQLVEQ
jgi:hypothetical protein